MRLLVPLGLLFALGCREAAVEIDDPKGGKDSGSPDDTGGDTGADTGDTGAVTAGDLSVSPATLDLGVIFVGQTASGSVTLSNVGTGSTSATLSIVGGWATAYTVDYYTSELSPGESSTHTLTLTPTTWGGHSVSVVIDESSSGERVEIPVTASVQEDADGDGHGSAQSGGDDCDDADPTLNPDAEEVWYDGIDQDCAGDDDYDQDGDGVLAPEGGGGDCDDLDPSTYPGAPDVWYDGIDSDCAGNDDYDQDADGYVPDDYVGLPTGNVPDTGNLPGGDCDDTDATINPAAAEGWYDGIDQDCSGTSDYDQDGDGDLAVAYGGSDCDDTNASVNPAAADTWYDGIDSDCAGDNDYDQDLDGVDYPTDCNDTDASVTGPVAETVDGIDNDCDGAVDDFTTSEIASGVIYGSSSSQAIGDHGRMAVATDLTGDGAADLVVGATATYGYVWVVTGASASTATGIVTAYDTVQVTGDSSSYPIGWLNGPFGDADGDGQDDLAFGGGSPSSSYYSTGRSYVLDGGSTLTGSVSSSSYAARVEGDDDYDCAYQSVLADLDGDGVAELVVGAPFDNYGSDWSSDYDAGSVSVFEGASGSDDLDDATDRIYGEDDYNYFGYSLTYGDLDGDGLDDIIASSPGYNGSSSDHGAVWIVNGNSSLAWDSRVDDAAEAMIEGDSYDLDLGLDTLARPGDIDGDGDLDLALSSESDGDVWLFLGVGALTGDYDLGDADHLLSGTAGDFGSMLVLDSDLDGDGADELAIGADGDDSGSSDGGSVFIYSYDSAWAASLDEDDATLSIYGDTSGAYFGSGGAGGADLDGDGRDDLAVGAASDDTAASNAGAIWIIPGW